MGRDPRFRAPPIDSSPKNFCYMGCPAELTGFHPLWWRCAFAPWRDTFLPSPKKYLVCGNVSCVILWWGYCLFVPEGGEDHDNLERE